MIDDDLNYVFLAPSLQWRGGRMFMEPHSKPAHFERGHLEVEETPIIIERPRPRPQRERAPRARKKVGK